ncbi:hypothetical protein FB451DRAFT_1240075 [Mycena latifolia]|nr:hypothetical protein FB451DRAFT_1240075 [Mycena latifolia]
MSPPIDEDVFSRILWHIPDSRTVHNVLLALPNSHLLFPAALHRLCQLPIYLGTYDARAAAASNSVLDHLLLPDGEHRPRIAESILHLVISTEGDQYWQYNRNRPVGLEEEERHDEDEEARGEEPSEEGKSTDNEESELVIDVAAFHGRLPELFKKTRNLEILDYHNYPGLPLSAESSALIAEYDRLGKFSVDGVITRVGGSGFEDPEIWDIEPFLASLGPSITSLDIRHVCQTMLLALASHADEFASYHSLTRLKMDITEGVWDWRGGGSPNAGATGDYVFPSLKLPVVQRFELVVGDLTLSEPRAGPLDLVDHRLLTELSLDVRQCNYYYSCEDIKLFEALNPANFGSLSHLEIKDNNPTVNTDRLSWVASGVGNRRFRGLVPTFLGSMIAGNLPKLTSLWVDERALLPFTWGLWELNQSNDLSAIYDTDELEELTPEITRWRECLRAVLSQLESLRVGFGLMMAEDVDLVLGYCDPLKLTQFGFELRWDWYGHEDPISPQLLAHLARFPHLTDVHILFPRPGTQVSGAPGAAVDARTLSDVTAIFACNGNVCRVGIGNSLLWERHYAPKSSDAPPKTLLVSDGSCGFNSAVPRFYHAGYLARYPPVGEGSRKYNDNATSIHQERGPEIEQLRDLLQRIL